MADPHDLISRLEDFANLEPPYQRWLGGDNADAGPSYCKPCAEKAVAAGKGEFVDGGFPGAEDDTCQHCETCGCLLHYSLTDYGVASELEHFSEHPPEAPVGKEEAYHIVRVLVAAPDNSEAVQLAERTLAEIGKTRTRAQASEEGS